jgi:peptide-methionine (S)-S-oxide reductase
MRFTKGVTLPAVVFFSTFALFAASTAPFPDPAIDQERAVSKGKQTAVFAGGCFWCTEAVFEHVAGVQKVVSGYAGGDAATAHYKIVGEGHTDHAESIEVTYDPSRITYGTLLKIFFSVAHDPTQLNRQGPDYGKQYRSAIFYNSPEQKRTAEAYIAQLSAAKVLSGPIVTQVVPLTKFYPAEDYHQDFVKNNPDHPYVVANALPKLQKLKKLYPDLIKK